MHHHMGVAERTSTKGYPPGTTFAVIELVTPWRIDHASLTEAIRTGCAVRFADELLIVVYDADQRVLDVLGADGVPLDDGTDTETALMR